MSIITLTDVKINNDYSWIMTVAPTASEKEPTYVNGDTWLNLTDGLSYELTDQTAGTWVQIEANTDAKINLNADDTLLMTNSSINNYFILDRNSSYFDLELDNVFPDDFNSRLQYALATTESVYSEWVFDSAGKTITAGDEVFGTLDNFAVGDVIYISQGLRNKDYFTITNVTSTVITVSEDVIDETANAFVSLTNIPQGYKNIVGRMVWYDTYERNETGQGMKSEKWGTYSYTRDAFMNGLRYPDQIIAGLLSYEGVITGGLSVFIN